MIRRRKIRTLIVDHSLEFRNILTKAIKELEYIKVVGRIGTLKLAFESVKNLKPDIILLDFEIPGADIGSVISDFKKIYPQVEVIITSTKFRTETNTSIKALDLGAFFFIRKPVGNSPSENVNYYKKYLSPVINLYRIKRSTKLIEKIRPGLASPKKFKKPPSCLDQVKVFNNFTLMAVCCSLGGPEALKKLIPKLPSDFPIPIVIVQHMPGGFTHSLSENLDANSQLIVREVMGGERLNRGYVYLAPGGIHLEINRVISASAYPPYVAVLSNAPPENGCRPAADVLFRSIARNVKGNILAAVLTGMGQDGLAGIKTLKKTGRTFCITQNEQSCIVYGMSSAIEEARLSDLSLSIEDVAKNINRIVFQNQKSNQTGIF